MSGYHRGELAVQTRAGVRDRSQHVGAAIGAVIPRVAAEFLTRQPALAVSARDASGRVWGSLIVGAPGFLHAADERHLAVAGRPVDGDPLAGTLAGEARVGTIAVEFHNRRRMRLNGRSTPTAEGLMIEADQVYANCPKYIQRRSPVGPTGETHPVATRSTRMTRAQERLVAATDTFFIATTDDAGNCDMSHRGGRPGFVRTSTENRLVFPDYLGNSMFMTLGNLAVNPRAGLLVPDWSTGATLHLTGIARIIWDENRVAGVPGAQRLVEFDIAEVVEVAGAMPVRWTDPEFSPALPDG